MDQYIGKMLDNRYEILELIGSGGMANVYKAKCQLREVIVDDQHVAAVIHEVFAERSARVGGDILQRGRGARRGVDDDSVVHRAAAGEVLHELGDGAGLLADLLWGL